MKRRKLIADVIYDFDLLGIITRVKDYKLAWNLNQTGYFHFVREPDIQMEFSDLSRIAISNFRDKDDMHEYLLIRNKLASSNTPKMQMVLNELKEFDFFLKLQTSVDDFDVDELISSLRKCQPINYLVKLDLQKIKSKENLVY